MFVLTTVVEIIVKKKTYFLVCYRLCHSSMRYLIMFTGQVIAPSAGDFCVNEYS